MPVSNVAKRDRISQDMRVKADLIRRFADVREYMIVVKKVTNYVPVFMAVNPALAGYETRLRKVWNGEASLDVGDAPMISELERVVVILKEAA